MRKTFAFFLLCMMLPLCLTAAGASKTAGNKTVYLDGTGATKDAYTTLSAALSALPDGGTVVLTGDTVIEKETTLPKSGAVVITSKHNGKDHTADASLQIEDALEGKDLRQSGVI